MPQAFMLASRKPLPPTASAFIRKSRRLLLAASEFSSTGMVLSSANVEVCTAWPARRCCVHAAASHAGGR